MVDWGSGAVSIKLSNTGVFPLIIAESEIQGIYTATYGGEK